MNAQRNPLINYEFYWVKRFGEWEVMEFYGSGLWQTGRDVSIPPDDEDIEEILHLPKPAA